MVTFNLHQFTEILDGPAYKVTNDVTSAEGASPAVYVFSTANKTFSNYASAADMARWPDSYELALTSGSLFYRSKTLVRKWPTVLQMNADLSTSVYRLKSLADELNAAQSGIVVDRNIVIEGA